MEPGQLFGQTKKPQRVHGLEYQDKPITNFGHTQRVGHAQRILRFLP